MRPIGAEPYNYSGDQTIRRLRRDGRRPRCPLSLGDGSVPAAEGEYM